MPKKDKKRLNTAERQTQIVDAARKLIIKFGSEHLTVRRIAKEIGVSEGAIYRHFRSKKEILSFLVDEIEKLLIGDIKKYCAANLNALEILEHIIIAHLSSVEQKSGMSFQVIAEIISLGDRKLNKKIFDVISKYIASIRDVLAKGVEGGVIREDIDLDAAATLFFGMVQGLISIWALARYSLDLQQKYAPLWNVFRNAISRR